MPITTNLHVDDNRMVSIRDGIWLTGTFLTGLALQSLVIETELLTVN
ncbi:MAG: hypothetical protein ACR2OW_10690 [Methyloligellaceae bacterium]